MKAFFSRIAFSFLVIVLFVNAKYARTTISPGLESYEEVRRTTDDCKIIKHDIKRGVSKCFVNGRLISLDPAGKKIAILTSSKLPKDTSKDDSHVYIYVLSVLDTASKSLIKSFPNVSSATFSADSTCMAYFADYPGRLEGEAPPGYEEGVWLYNFETKLNKKIAKAAIDINWAEFDGNIYILYGHEVTCYNTKTDRVESTSYKGIYFSPNGEYYASKIDPEGPYWTIYRTSDNQEMTEWMNTIKRKGGDIGVYDFQFWSKKLKAVVFRISNSENMIFDIDQGKTIGYFEGIFIGTNYDGSMVAVHPIIKEKPGVDFSKAKIIDLTKFKK